MKRNLLIFATLLSLLMFSAGIAQATVFLKFDPESSVVGVGSSFDVRINADIPESEALVGWGFDLLYDPAQLLLNSVSYGPVWDPSPLAEGDFLSALLFPGPEPADPAVFGNDFSLATLRFTCQAPGISRLGIYADPSDMIEGFATFDGNYAEWQFTPGSIEQLDQELPVPEPSTILLLGVGLAGLAFFSKRSRKS